MNLTQFIDEARRLAAKYGLFTVLRVIEFARRSWPAVQVALRQYGSVSVAFPHIIRIAGIR